MAELPPPDLRDHRGRFHRILIALAAACTLAALAWWVTTTYTAVGRDLVRGDAAARTLVFFVVAVALAVGYQLTHALLVRRDRRRWLAARIPQARVRA